MTVNDFGALSTLSTRSGSLRFFRLDSLEHAGLCRLDTLPFSLRVLLEALLRQVDGRSITIDDVRRWPPGRPPPSGALKSPSCRRAS